MDSDHKSTPEPQYTQIPVHLAGVIIACCAWVLLSILWSLKRWAWVRFSCSQAWYTCSVIANHIPAQRSNASYSYTQREKEGWNTGSDVKRIVSASQWGSVEQGQLSSGMAQVNSRHSWLVPCEYTLRPHSNLAPITSPYQLSLNLHISVKYLLQVPNQVAIQNCFIFDME